MAITAEREPMYLANVSLYVSRVTDHEDHTLTIHSHPTPPEHRPDSDGRYSLAIIGNYGITHLQCLKDCNHFLQLCCGLR